VSWNEFAYQFWLFRTAKMSALSKLFPSNSRVLIDGGLVHWLVFDVFVNANALMVENRDRRLKTSFKSILLHPFGPRRL